MTAQEWEALETNPRVTIHGSYLDAEQEEGDDGR